MGLDMYLFKAKKQKEISFEKLLEINSKLDEIQENDSEYFQQLIDENIISEKGDYYKFYSPFEEIGYWRKANHIHNWFVENVQGGEDYCNPYEVSKDQIEELLNICKKVLDGSQLVDGDVVNGYRMDENGQTAIIEKGKIIDNAELADQLLPTVSGFFFGNTDYNEYYYNDIKSTIEQLTEVLEDVDFDEYHVIYQSSW